MYKKLVNVTEILRLLEKTANKNLTRMDVALCFNSLMMILGEETFNFWWEACEENFENDFDFRFEQFHKNMRNQSFFDQNGKYDFTSNANPNGKRHISAALDMTL